VRLETTHSPNQGGNLHCSSKTALFVPLAATTLKSEKAWTVSLFQVVLFRSIPESPVARIEQQNHLPPNQKINTQLLKVHTSAYRTEWVRKKCGRTIGMIDCNYVAGNTQTAQSSAFP